MYAERSENHVFSYLSRFAAREPVGREAKRGLDKVAIGHFIDSLGGACGPAITALASTRRFLLAYFRTRLFYKPGLVLSVMRRRYFSIETERAASSVFPAQKQQPAEHPDVPQADSAGGQGVE